jgi:tetratricopeptide (TPR) repeat protein
MDLRRTRTPNTARLTIIAFFGVAALLAAPRGCQARDDSIEGQVRTSTGTALPNVVRVRLELAANVVVDRQLVGTSGRFAFYNLRDQNYQVIVTADGYQPATVQVDMHYLASRFPTIYLMPLGPKKTPPPPKESITDLAAPKKSRKEYEKGHEALMAKDLAGAREHLERAVAEDPCYARALTALGVVLALKKEFPAAETSFKKSIQCDGGFLEAYFQMQILLDSEKKYSESEAMLEQGLRVAPSDWQLHYRVGAEHHHLQEYQQAEEEYLKAESLSSDVPTEVHLRLADAYMQLKRYDQAYTEMQTYLRVDPNGRLASQTRSMLQRMESMRNSKVPPSKEAPQN